MRFSHESALQNVKYINIGFISFCDPKGLFICNVIYIFFLPDVSVMV